MKIYAALVHPIKQKVINVNKIGTKSANGSAPVSLFQPLWMASIISADIIFIAVSKLIVKNRRERLRMKIGKIVMGAIMSLAVGFGLTWLSEEMLGLYIPKFMDTALFLSIASLSFYLMTLAVLSWIGLKGIPFFVLLLFFGGPLLAMAPEMMTPFYRDYVYAWLPPRFLVEGLRELFFFDKGLSWNSQVATFFWIGVVSSIVILSSSIKHKTVEQAEVTE